MLKKQIDWNQLISLAVALLIFTIPSNLFKVFLESSAYVRGLKVDYLIPKLHLSDLVLLLLLLILLFFLFSQKKQKQSIKNLKKIIEKNKLLIALSGALIFLQIFSSHQVTSFLFVLRIALLVIAFKLLAPQREIFYSKIITTAIKITLLFQSLLAWFQFITQKSLLGYYFFGETNLNNYAGIAQSNLLGVQKILPYGTTAHPNILGGILAFLCLLQLHETKKQKQFTRINTIILLIGISSLVLTQSISAIMAFTVGSFLIFYKKKIQFSLQRIFTIFVATSIASILFFAGLSQTSLAKNTSISRREYLNSASVHMIFQNSIKGVGLQNFTARLETYSNSAEVVRFVQPVHNILLLWTSETGILGVFFVSYIFVCMKNNKSIQHPEFLLALIPIAALDHYLLTTQSGILLALFCLLYATTD